ncbi:glycosyltransferase family 4 protein [Candidatus Uhrbacteria bacterium]|nr:glycosyltransferase family 4 protein [Candidatus Uhrbacteria bacterium]
MRIGIDARMYGPKVGGGGLGRYVEQLVTELQAQDQENRYVLFLKKENFDACRIRNPHFEKRLADIHWYTAAEQLRLPAILHRAGVDLMHFPHWNVPLLSGIPFVVTIHDLILLEEPRSARATTLDPLRYRIKYEAYRLAVRHALQKSRRIIAVSQTTKDAIQRFFPDVLEGKIDVVYEGLTTWQKPEGAEPAPPVSGPFVLYVGNAYPHKNLEALLEAFVRIARSDIHLVLAGPDDMFYARLRARAASLPLPAGVIHFVPSPDDAAVAALYRQASLYVFPSRIEGFGLPPLEAMAQGVPVAASNRSAMPEILGDAVAYFNPTDSVDMATVIQRVLSDAGEREVLRIRGFERVKKYAWGTMAREIRDVYRRSAL